MARSVHIHDGKSDMASAVAGVEKAAEKSIRIDENDYTKDGLIYCGKCHTPKEYRIVLWGQPKTVRCLCKCATEAREAEERANEAKAKAERIERMRNKGFNDPVMKTWTFAADDGADPKSLKVAHNYVDNFDEMKQRGKGLLLYGNVGTGKTYIAACIVNALIEKGYFCLMTSFAQIERNPIDLSMYQLVVIDDLAAERDTGYMSEIVHSVIDARYRSGLPLIVTTNLTAQELKQAQDIRKERVYSRLFEMCVPVEVKGSDRRKKKLKEDYTELKGILGL